MKSYVKVNSMELLSNLPEPKTNNTSAIILVL